MKRATLALAAGAAMMLASAAVAHPVGVDSGAMDKRFQEMDRMMDGMGQMHGPARRAWLRDHMRLMNEQMGAMHGMQGGHGHGGPMMGQAPSGGPSGAAPAGPDMQQRMGAMEQRMDAMQRMMEHMLRQQEMLEDDDRS